MTDDLQGPEAGAEEVRSAPPVLVPQPRAPWTWIVLAALFALLIGTRFLVTPDDPKSAIDEATVDTSLRLAFVSREAGSLLASGPSTEAVKGPSARELTEIRGKVAPHIASDPLAAKYELAIGAELGEPPNATALKTLEESKPEDRTVATVYRSAPLDPGGLSAVEKAAPEGFLGKVVVAQARSKATGKSVRPVNQGDVMAVAFGGLLMVGVVFVGLIVLALSPMLVKSFRNAGTIVPSSRPTRSEGDRLAMRTSVFLVCFIVVMSAVPVVFQNLFLPGISTVTAYVVLIGAMAFLSAVPFLGHADPLGKVIGRKDRKPLLAAMGALAFAANIPVVGLTAVVASLLFPNMPRPHHPVSEMVGKDLNPVTVACLFVMVGLMAPIVEEIGFRGFLFRGLSAYVRPVAAMAVSGLLFAAIHPQGILMWVPLGLVGAMAALLTHWTQSLLPAMVMHGLHNTFLMVVAFSVLGT